jgi:hypothetical protein
VDLVLMIWKFCWTSAGDNPIDGSSISSRRGRDIRARPIATICCSPPDSVPGELAAPLVQAREQLVDALEVLVRVDSPLRSTAPSSRFSRTVSWPNRRRFSGTMAIPAAMRCGTGHCSRPRPSSSTRPERGRTMPRIVFSVVDLPDALPPSRQTSSPAPTWSEIPSRIRICRSRW